MHEPADILCGAVVGGAHVEHAVVADDDLFFLTQRLRSRIADLLPLFPLDRGLAGTREQSAVDIGVPYS